MRALSTAERAQERESVAPQVMVLPQPWKHLKFAPSEVQSLSAAHVFEQDFPALRQVIPPSVPPNTARSRQAPEAQSPSAPHGLPLPRAALLEQPSPTSAVATKKANAERTAVMRERLALQSEKSFVR
jgi:hypothetical protein